MKKLKVGMYVRNERGIAKYLGLGKDVLKDKERREFKHYAMQHLFDEPIFDVGHDWGDTLSEEEFKNIDRYIIGEPSKNIIDLIEENDFINGLIVEKNKYGELYTSYVYYGGGIGKQCEVYTIWLKEYTEDMIENIVTKEQFDSVRYEVE